MRPFPPRGSDLEIIYRGGVGGDNNGEDAVVST